MISSIYTNMNDTLSRKIDGKVEFYNGSTLLEAFLATDKLQEITISRTGEKGKFFGFGICQQATVKIVDKLNEITFYKNETLETSFRANSAGDYVKVCPSFYIKDIKRDEKTNVITVTAYDALDVATGHTFSELNIIAPYTIKDVVEQVSSVLELSSYSVDTSFNINYETGANFSGNETLREVLNAIAEVTQTIYYLDHTNRLVFKRLVAGDSDLTINKKDYFELTTALPVTISKIISATELGDNVYAGDDTGVTQYVRDNPFWNTRLDLNTLLPEALNRISGLTITPHNIKWRGNFLTEIGDKIALESKDGSLVTTYILNDSFTYNGGFNQTTSWEYAVDSEKTTSANPVTISEKINQTVAKVDKVNKEITLMVEEVAEAKSITSELQVESSGINASVKSLESKTTDSIDALSNTVSALTKEVNLKMDSEAVSISINKALEDGVNKVKTTSKNYTFDDKGLKIESSDSEFNTTVDENGMRIYNYNTEVLTVNNQGVKAADLHARTFLIIGENSRLEDRGRRTACFWIGPAEE